MGGLKLSSFFSQFALYYKQQKNKVMGYTHYYYRASKLAKKQFNLFAKDVEKIFEFAKENDYLLAGEMGEEGTLPIANEELICFNGVGVDSCESLFINRVDYSQSVRGFVSEWCKTCRNPYDDIVVAVLIRFKHHFPKVKLDIGDLKEGAEICNKIF